jgi:hypothetical protein
MILHRHYFCQKENKILKITAERKEDVNGILPANSIAYSGQENHIYKNNSITFVRQKSLFLQRYKNLHYYDN